MCKIPKVGVCELFLNPFPFPHWELWDLENPFFLRATLLLLFLQYPFSETCGYIEVGKELGGS